MERQTIQSDLTYITKTIKFSSMSYNDLNKSLYGNNYRLHVTLKGSPALETGMIINLIDLKSILKEKILTQFDYKTLNDTVHFKQNLPTLEKLCIVCWQLLAPELAYKLHKVTLDENEKLVAYYKGEHNMVYLTRIYNFSASHRLHNPQLSDERNQAVFGKCNNYNAHGHNFKLEVTLKGEINPETGLIYDQLDMDQTVNDLIINRLDHKNLNKDVEDLTNTITTGESLIIYMWQHLDGQFAPASLYKLKLFETDRNYFEYKGNN